VSTGVSRLRVGPPAWLQALPFGAVFAFFFIAPLLLIGAVSFWPTSDYELIPGFTGQNYVAIFDGCSNLAAPCVTLKTYLSTLRFSLLTWAVSLVLGFTIAYFLAFHVRRAAMQTLLFVLCTIPFWTSNVIRMISWVPLLGRNGLLNQGLVGAGVVEQPIEWLLFSEFSVVLAFVHLYTMFMLVPIFNSMMRIDRALLEAADDAGASGWQTLWNVIVPLSRTGIVIGSIFVITIVMGDFVTVGVMGGQQIASVGKIIQVQTSYLQFPLAAANAVVLLAVVLMIIVALTRLVDLRKEL
jgi:putative spermidine/putrescine transport system permease protein